MKQLRVVHTCLPRPIGVGTPVHPPPLGKSTADLYMTSNTFGFEFYNTFSKIVTIFLRGVRDMPSR